jgi:succinate dehydrogenase / fumarate reductase cytochrome b subunit
VSDPSAHSHASTTSVQAPFLERHYHLLRRLHSLSGVVPIGVFLFPHLTTNSSIVWGEAFNAKKYADFGPGAAGVATFQHEVNFIHDLPALIFIEIFVLWLPIAYHAVLGVYFARSGKANTERYAYQANWRYTMQRVSGYLGVLFLFMHISSLRWGWSYGGLMPSFDAHNAASTTALHLQGGLFPYFNAFFYLVCVLALVFHFANGLWTAAITWGLTVSKQAQQRWGVVCTAVGLSLAAAGVTAVVGFASLDTSMANEVETKMKMRSGLVSAEGAAPTAAPAPVQ